MDVSHTCRLCLFKSDDLCDMNTTMSESICLLEAMHYTFGQECILDSLPKLVCKQCAIDIEFTYSFRQKCEKSFEAFGEFLVKHENKNYSDDGETDEFEIQSQWDKMGEDKYTIELYSETGYECKSNGRKQKVLEFDEFADDEEVVIKSEVKDEWEEKNYCELSNLDAGSMNFYNDDSSVNNSEVKFTSFGEGDEGSFESNEGDGTQISVSADEADEPSPDNTTLLHIRPFKCDTCGKTFLRKWNWKQHQMIHNHNKPHICSTCGKSFTTRCVLRDHEARHTNDRPFVCEVCDKRFGTRQVLKRHMMTHSTEKRYTCETCGKAFSQKCSLQYHEVTHSGVRPHACDKCDKKFMRRWNLRQHLLTHAPNWGSVVDNDGGSNKVTNSEQPTVELLKS